MKDILNIFIPVLLLFIGVATVIELGYSFYAISGALVAGYAGNKIFQYIKNNR